MVKFEVNRVINGLTEIKNLYAIHGSNKTNNPKLLIVGSQINYGDELPVIDITDSYHAARCYFEDTCAADVCEDFGIDPQTALYISNYNAFELIFHYDEEED